MSLVITARRAAVAQGLAQAPDQGGLAGPDRPADPDPHGAAAALYVVATSARIVFDVIMPVTVRAHHCTSPTQP